MPGPVTELGATGLQNHGTGWPSFSAFVAIDQYSHPLAASASTATIAAARTRRIVIVVPSRPGSPTGDRRPGRYLTLR